MQEKITHIIKEASKNIQIEEVDFLVEHPEDFGKWRLLDKYGDGFNEKYCKSAR